MRRLPVSSAGGTDQGLVVKEKRFRLIAIGRARQAFAMSGRRIQLRLSEPKATLAPKVGDKAAAVQDGADLAVESCPDRGQTTLCTSLFRQNAAPSPALSTTVRMDLPGATATAPAGQAAPRCRRAQPAKQTEGRKAPSPRR